MKKKIRSLLAMTLAVLLVFGLVACGSTNSTNETPTQNGQNEGGRLATLLMRRIRPLR